MRTHIVFLTLATLACTPEIPGNPTYFDDVQAILRANCARCHGADPIDPNDPSITGFRLDRYVANDGGTDVPSKFNQDAFEMRERIFLRAVETVDMPPTFMLSDRQKTILQRWVDQGAPKGSRANQVPEIVAIEPAGALPTVDQSLDLTYLATDADGDGLMVAIFVRTADADLFPFQGLGGGQRQVTIDAGQLASGQSVDVWAIVDDGFSDDPVQNRHEVVLLSNVAIDHGARGTAPTVSLLAPNGAEALIESPASITWSASDPDPGDVLLIDLMLLRVDSNGTEVEAGAIATGISNNQIFSWDTSAVPDVDGNNDAIDYKVRVTATDAGGLNTRSDTSDAIFNIVRGTGMTDLTWPDVAPIFVNPNDGTYCGKCHAANPVIPTVNYFRLDKYDRSEAPTDKDGVYEVRARVLQRMVDGTMPQATEPQPSAAEIAMVREWILAGAPFGSGPVDGQPVFTWGTPNNGAVTNTTTGTVTLTWIATDPEMLPFAAGDISVVRAPMGPAQTYTCTAQLTGWSALGADVTTGSLSWTAPSQGCYCFKGELTDAANQITVSVAIKPIKWGIGQLCP